MPTCVGDYKEGMPWLLNTLTYSSRHHVSSECLPVTRNSRVLSNKRILIRGFRAPINYSLANRINPEETTRRAMVTEDEASSLILDPLWTTIAFQSDLFRSLCSLEDTISHYHVVRELFIKVKLQSSIAQEDPGLM